MIIIKTLDMPENCRWCPFRETVDNKHYCVVEAGKRIKGDALSERPNWCPVEEVK